MDKLIGLLGSEGDARPGRTESAASGVSGAVFLDTARCRAQRLPRRIPYACMANRQTETPSPELLGRVLEGLKRL